MSGTVHWASCRTALIAHRHLLAFVSDLHLLSPALQPHSMTWNTQGSTSVNLDHAIWFHRPFQLDK